MSSFDNLIKSLTDITTQLTEAVDKATKDAKVETDYYKKGIYIHYGMTVSYLAILSNVTKFIMQNIEELTKRIDQLPDTKEFFALKTEHEQFREEAKPAIKAIIDLYNEHKEREKRGQDIYD